MTLFLMWVQALVLGLALKGLAKTVDLARDKSAFWVEEFKLKKCALVEAAKRNLRDAVWVLGDQFKGDPEVDFSLLNEALEASAETSMKDLEAYYGARLDSCGDKRDFFDIVLERHQGQPDHWPNWVYRRRFHEKIEEE